MLGKIAKACDSHDEFKNLRQLVFDYYYGEDDYIFETEELEMIFGVLSSYLEYEEAYGNTRKQIRLRRLKKVFQQDKWSVEHVIYALEYDQLADLLDKYESGILTEGVLESQVRKLSPVPFDSRAVISLYKAKGKGFNRSGATL